MARAGQVRIGVSGWRYGGWRGVFYPDGLRQKDELSFLARNFPTVEINGTFYSLQRPEFFQTWSAEAPADFTFAVKGSRYITHMLRLTNAETPLANFFASGVLALGRKLGPILWWLGLTALATWILLRTRFGNWIFTVGGDANAARNVGVPVASVKIRLFILSACAGSPPSIRSVSRSG